MYPVMKEGEKLHFISDNDGIEPPFKVNLLMKKELYQNGRKQGFLAECEETGKLYFLKILFTGNLDDTFVQKESKVQLYSPFIIRIYGGMLDRKNNRFFTLIEYRKEQDVSDLIRFGGLSHYTAEERIRIKHKIVLKILYGIHHYMSMYETDPIIHRDLKPENVMASPDGQIVKIIDFDWVHLHQSNATVMDRREQKGTLGYAEPKSWNSYHADVKMDIYSAGLLFYFIYMEKHHFSGQDEISAYLMANDYSYTLKPTPGMDEELRTILQKMIGREEERYCHIREVIRDFVHYLKSKNCYPDIPELMMEESGKSIRICYRIGSVIYTPVIKEGHFYPIEFGSRQLRSKNGRLTSHILSFYYIGSQLKNVILDDRCKKTLSIDENEDILNPGDQFSYADTMVEILKTEEVL